MAGNGLNSPNNQSPSNPSSGGSNWWRPSQPSTPFSPAPPRTNSLNRQSSRPARSGQDLVFGQGPAPSYGRAFGPSPTNFNFRQWMSRGPTNTYGRPTPQTQQTPSAVAPVNYSSLPQGIFSGPKPVAGRSQHVSTLYDQNKHPNIQPVFSVTPNSSRANRGQRYGTVFGGSPPANASPTYFAPGGTMPMPPLAPPEQLPPGTFAPRTYADSLIDSGIPQTAAIVGGTTLTAGALGSAAARGYLPKNIPGAQAARNFASAAATRAPTLTNAASAVGRRLAPFAKFAPLTGITEVGAGLGDIGGVALGLESVDDWMARADASGTFNGMPPQSGNGLEYGAAALDAYNQGLLTNLISGGRGAGESLYHLSNSTPYWTEDSARFARHALGMPQPVTPVDVFRQENMQYQRPIVTNPDLPPVDAYDYRFNPEKAPAVRNWTPTFERVRGG